MTPEQRPAPEDDELLRALRELPVHPATAAPGSRGQHEARAAFVHAFDDTAWYARPFGDARQAAIPVVLASIVGLYLFWAFAAAIALNH